MRTWLALWILGAALGPACGGGDVVGADAATTDSGCGAGCAPAVRAVIPAAGRPDRTLDVIVLVEDVTVDAATTLELGAGIAVSEVTPRSATSLSARLTLAADAAYGARDVTVVAGGASVVAAGGFTVGPHLAVEVVSGTPTQGGLIDIEIESLDAVPLFPPVLFERGAWAVAARETSPTSWKGVIALDPGAAADLPIAVRNASATFEPRERFTAPPVAVTAAAATPVALPSNELVRLSGKVAAPMTTVVYELATPGAGVLSVGLRRNVDGPVWVPTMALLAGGGTYQDLIVNRGPGTILVATPATPASLYLVIRDHDLGGTSDHDYELTLIHGEASETAEQPGPHATTQTAQVLAGGLRIVSGELAAGDGQDVYVTTLSSAVITLHTDADLELAVIDTVGATIVAATDRPFDRLAAVPIGGGAPRTYFLVVRPRPGTVGRPTGTYTLIAG